MEQLLRDLHRRHIGRALLDQVETDLRAAGVKLLQVKTLGPSGFSDDGARIVNLEYHVH